MRATVTAVPGVLAGHWTHATGTTGVTAFLFPDGATGGLAQPGHAAGTRELGALDPLHVAPRIHGFCLSGGSAFGLSAADGVVQHLEARGVGFDTGFGRVPIVPTAILFDLPVAATRPGAPEGRAAADAASTAPLAGGRVGAGAGARVAKAAGGPLPGGFASVARRIDLEDSAGAPWVGAAAAVNAFGSIRDPATGAWVAGGPAGGAATAGPGSTPAAPPPGDWTGQNTTLVVVATEASLTRPQATLVARMAAAGIARTTWPAFTPYDGDTVFVAATGQGAPVGTAQLLRLGDAAAALVAEAIVLAVRPPTPESP